MMYEQVITQFVKMLENFSGIFDKAAAHADLRKFDMKVLLESRLAPDQLNFTRQIQIMCDTAKRGAAQLANKEAPVHADTESTLPELKARIESVIGYLRTYTPKDFAEGPTRRISQARWEGQYLTGQEFLLQHCVPNFYFHMTTAYAILRHNGVDLGKKDYLGKMPYKKD